MRLFFFVLFAFFVAAGRGERCCAHVGIAEVQEYIDAVAGSVPVRYENKAEVEKVALELVCRQLSRFSLGMRSDHLHVAAAYARLFKNFNPHAVAEWPDAFLWLTVVLLQIAYNYHSDNKFRATDLAKFMDVSTADAEFMYIGVLKALRYDLRMHYCKKRIPAYSREKCDCKENEC